MGKQCVVLMLVGAAVLGAEAPPKSVNPLVEKIVSQVSASRIADIEKKLGTFETRNIYSSLDDPQHGIGAAREWIAAQFRSFSPRLQVSFDKHRVKGQPKARYNKDVEL